MADAEPAGASPGLLPTLTGQATPWEIDANLHWNTQFYLRAFGHATAQAAAAAGGADADAAPGPRVTHLRFFRELRANETFTVGSARVAGAGPYRIAHLLHHGTSGALCTAALVSGEGEGRALPPLPPDLAARVAPRGLPAGAGADAGDVAAALLRAGRATVSHATVLRPADFGPDGEMTAQAVQDRLSDGTGTTWNAAGIEYRDLLGRGLGGAIVEMKLVRHRRAVPGQAVRMVGWLELAGARGLLQRQRMECLATGAALAESALLMLVIDMVTRRSVPLPDDMRRRLEGEAQGAGAGAGSIGPA